MWKRKGQVLLGTGALAEKKEKGREEERHPENQSQIINEETRTCRQFLWKSISYIQG